METLLSAFNVAQSIHPFLPGTHKAYIRSLAGLNARAHAGAGMPSYHGVRHESHTVRTVIHGVRVLLLEIARSSPRKNGVPNVVCGKGTWRGAAGQGAAAFLNTAAGEAAPVHPAQLCGKATALVVADLQYR